MTLEDRKENLRSQYPWIQGPLVANAPMRLIAGPKMATAVHSAGGFGFIASGTETATLPAMLDEVGAIMGFKSAEDIDSEEESSNNQAPNGHAKSQQNSDEKAKILLPIGVGFINWAADLPLAIEAITKWRPAAVWFFAPAMLSDLLTWTRAIRDASGDATRIWVQVGTVKTALEVAESCAPDVLVIQGSDAGGHGLEQSASLMTLLPECVDALEEKGFGHIPLIAAGGIVEARGALAAMTLGANGVCLGTRFLATPEAEIAKGYQQAVLDATDGGISTARTKVYDRLRGTTGWPEAYNARGVINASFRDAKNGMSEAENKELYHKALAKGDEGWGAESGRVTTYAGSGVGLIKEVKSSGDVVWEIREALLGH